MTATPIDGMAYPTRSGATVQVLAEQRAYSPYSWECSAGHRSDAPSVYAGLPFARRDAEAHAAGCRKRPKRGAR